MILQELTTYYDRISRDDSSEIAPEGFEKKEIPYIIVLDREGRFMGIDDTRSGEGKKKRARAFIVPKAVKRSSGVAANLLWDSPAYVLGCPKPDKKKDPQKLLERAKEQHGSFIKKIEGAFQGPITDEGVTAVLRFLRSGDFNAVFGHPLWQEVEESGANISFRLEGDSELVCQRESVRSTIARTEDSKSDALQPCLITGDMDSPARLHTAIKGVWGAQSSGANIVSFNLTAFESYGKEQGFNAPIGNKAEHMYTTALNKLLAKDSRQRIQVGDTSTVFWADQKNMLEDIFTDLFGEPAKENPEQANQAIRVLFESPKIGAQPLDDDYTPFHVLGLSPNASRIAVRFWHNGTVGEVTKNIKQHFNDCTIVHGPKEQDYLSIFRLLVSTAVQGKADNIQPNLAGEVMKSILSGTPYPQSLLSSSVRRCKAEREIAYPRASLIKAVLVRSSRYCGTEYKEVGMSLDRENANPGYLLGRLFAVLEKAQERANPGIDATIRDRFYGAASSTPVTVFPRLLKLKNHHISKLENRGEAVNLEKLMGEIVDAIRDFPALLSLPDQGRFAIGYYHQRQDFFKKKEQKTQGGMQ